MLRRLDILQAPEGDASGGGATDWRTALPEDLRGAPALKDVKDVAGLAKRFVDTQAMVGSSVRPPGPDAGPEDKKAFREKMLALDPDLAVVPAEERPVKDAKGYKFDGLPLDGVNVEQLAAEAVTLGLSQAQAKKFAERTAAAARAQQDQIAGVKAGLKAEFGTALDQALREADAAAEMAGAPQVVREAIKNGTADKDTVRMFRNLAKSLGAQPREVATQERGSGPAITPSEAESRINEIMKRPEFLEPGKNPDEHRRLVQEVARLEAFASPDLVGT